MYEHDSSYTQGVRMERSTEICWILLNGDGWYYLMGAGLGENN